MRTYTFPAVAERGDQGFGAWFPDLPGCVSGGDTMSELAEMAREALTLHLEGMLHDGEPIPEPTPVEGVRLDPAAGEIGVLLVTAAPGGASQVTLSLSQEALRRADKAAAASGRTRERVLTDQLEALLSAG